MWGLLEPVHGLVYSPPKVPGLEEIGVRGFWRGYFASRVAPLGNVGAPAVVASFFSFAPGIVSRAIPEVWQRATPEQVLVARQRGASETLRALIQTPDDETLHLLAEAVAAADHSGRVLAAANAALPTPDDPLARLWQATTVLREHRGDGHVAALVAAGISGCESLVLRCGLDLSREILQPARGWTDDEWTNTAVGLVERGLLDAAGRATAAGEALFRDVEDVTDRCAAGPWRALGQRGTVRLAESLAPMAVVCRAASALPDLLGLPAAGPVAAG
jgi:hypothetical protein